MASESPTQRTLKELRASGYVAQVVERYCSFSRRRIDLLGGIDIVAVRPGEILGVQCTTASNAAARVHKLRAEPQLAAWVAAGAKLQVWGWAKRGKRGERKTWTASKVAIEYFIEPETNDG